MGRRFKRFVRDNLPSFASAERADCLYDDFRNGLIHEGRIKSGAQFSLDAGDTITDIEGIVLVNPMLLADEVSVALDRFIEVLHGDAVARRRFSDNLSRDHGDDRVSHEGPRL